MFYGYRINGLAEHWDLEPKVPGGSLNLWDLEEASLGFGAHVFKELVGGDQRSLGLCWNLDNLVWGCPRQWPSAAVRAMSRV